MSGVRDPAFWKRFSTAVHLDEEHGTSKADAKDSDSWLARQQRKSSRRTKICWAFWLVLAGVITLIIIVFAWLIQSGVFNKVALGTAKASS